MAAGVRRVVMQARRDFLRCEWLRSDAGDLLASAALGLLVRTCMGSNGPLDMLMSTARETPIALLPLNSR